MSRAQLRKKDLRQDQDDLVHRRVEEPVVLPREEQGVEYHKSPLKVQGGQQAHHGEDDAQPRGSPEAGAPAQKGRGTRPIRRPSRNQRSRRAADKASTARSSRKRTRTSAKWSRPDCDQDSAPVENSGAPRQKSSISS